MIHFTYLKKIHYLYTYKEYHKQFWITQDVLYKNGVSKVITLTNNKIICDQNTKMVCNTNKLHMSACT